MSRYYEPISSLFLILMVCMLSFGVFLPRLGFYWDDYASLYVINRQGSDVFTEWSSGQARPLAGLFSTWMWDSVGARPLGWQLFHFALYFASVVLFWRVLRLLWREYRPQTTLMALLFAVYPSYHLRPVPVSFELIISLVIFLASFGLSLWAAQRDSLALAVLGALLVPVYQLTYEQNLPFEALRPLAILYVVGVANWRRAARLWMVYPLAVLGLVYYRLVLFQPSETYSSYNAFQVENPLLIFKLSVAAPVKMLVVDWVAMPWRLIADVDVPGALGVPALVACLLYLWRWDSQRRYAPRLVLVVALLSLATMAALLLSVHVVGRALQDGFNSRWALSPSLLAAVVLGMGVPALLRSNALGHLLLALLVMVGVGVQTAVNQQFAADWALRRELGWQLHWRAPALEPASVYVLNTPPDTFAFGRILPDYELTAHASLYYPPQPYPAVGGATPFTARGLVETGRTSGVWSVARSGRESVFEDWHFDLQNTLVLGYDGNCLFTADPRVSVQNMANDSYTSLAPLHNPGAIRPVALADVPPPADLVQPEPPHGWCFYYQQIQWALQFGDESDLQPLLDAVAQGGLRAPYGHEAEWIPFILAANRLGAYEQAVNYIRFFRLSDPHTQAALCAQLGIEPSTPPEQYALIPGCAHPAHR